MRLPMRAVWSIAVIVAIGFVAASVVSERAYKADAMKARLEQIAKRVRAYRDATGRWPDRFAAMAPPHCDGGECILTKDAAGSLEEGHRLMLTSDGVEVTEPTAASRSA